MVWKNSRKSIKAYLLSMGIAISVMLLLVMLGFGGYIVIQYRQAYEREHEIMTENYAGKLEQDILSLETYVRTQYSDNVHYQMLKRPMITESQWMLATYYLDNTFSGKTDNMDFFGGVFFYDETLDTLRGEFSGHQFSGDSYRLNLQIKQEMREHACGNVTYRGIMDYDSEKYLLYTVGDHENYLGYVINLSRYFPQVNDLEIVILDEAGEVLVDQGNMQIEDQIIRNVQNGGTNGLNLTYVAAARKLYADRLTLVMIHQDRNMAFWNRPEFWLIFLLIPCAAMLMVRHLYITVKRIIYQPIEHVMYRLTEMKQDNESPGVQPAREEQRAEEIVVINARLDQLISEMRRLEQEKYEKEKEADAALLQYYQLQVRPHFFLNCLNIIASLLNENDVGSVKNMIFAVSKHFRYVFQNSESLVTVEEELDEINAYCNIYIIKNAMPMLLQINVDDAFLQYKIPLLCIQTFIENSIKYAACREQVLALTVKAEKIKAYENWYFRIYISDNGTGYPQDILEKLNQPIKKFQYHSRHVGIDNLKYRIYLLYGERARLYFYNSPSGGAVTEILLPWKEC